MTKKVIHLTEHELRNLIGCICESVIHENTSEKTFKIYKGSIPIMVSAPHASSHLRDDERLPEEWLTGKLAMQLHNELGCHCIVQNKASEYDPNYDKNNEYQTELLKYINSNGILFLIDLHGCDDNNDFAIDIGTAGADIKPILDKILPKHELDGMPITYNKKFEAVKNSTITKLISGSQSKCKAIQLEINAAFRDSDDKKKFSLLTDFMGELINNIKKKAT